MQPLTFFIYQICKKIKSISCKKFKKGILFLFQLVLYIYCGWQSDKHHLSFTLFYRAKFTIGSTLYMSLCYCSSCTEAAAVLL